MSTVQPTSIERGASPITDIASLRADFPILNQNVHGKPLVYLDSAASAQRPQAVIDAMVAHEQRDHANIHRGVHQLSQRSTEAYERARERVRAFINAGSAEEVIFTRGTTESINLVAAAFGSMTLGPGDEVLVTRMEHHSNIVPWQLVCARTGATLVPAPITPRGEVDIDAYERLLSGRTKIAALAHVSNALGTVNPVNDMTAKARNVGAAVVIDGAQAAPHLQVDVRDIDCDFYAFSGHKMYGPTGIGVLYGKAALLEAMPPYQGGGEMILTVSFEGTTYADPPHKYEAGTPNITGAIGLGATIDYLAGIDFEARYRHEAELLGYATEALRELPGSRIIGEAEHKSGALSFLLGDIHAHDLGTILDRAGVAVRTGHHCAMPVMEFFNIPATTRASFAIYNNRDDVDRLVAGLKRALELFS